MESELLATARPPDPVFDAAILIFESNLPHPLPYILRVFVHNALDKLGAANYVLRFCTAKEDPEALKSQLLELAADWTFILESVSRHGVIPPEPDAATKEAIARRDGQKCCITGKPGTRSDPLIVAPIIPIPVQWLQEGPQSARVLAMLQAFFGTQYRDWWLAYAKNPKLVNGFESHFLVRKSAARAFSEFRITLSRKMPSMTEYEVVQIEAAVPTPPIEVDGTIALLGDHSRTGLPKIDPRLAGTHWRFSYAMRWLAIAEEMDQLNAPNPIRAARGTTFLGLSSEPRPSPGLSFVQRLKKLLLAIWRRFPDRLRVAVYMMLRRVGYRLYGKSRLDTSRTQRLPFGLYLKTRSHPEEMRNEFNALQLVAQHTNVLTPEPIDLVFARDKGGCADQDEGFLITTRVKGYQLCDALNLVSEKDEAGIVAQMQDFIRQLRTIPKTVNPDHAICNTLGRAVRDSRIQWAHPMGPFVDEAAFNKCLRFPDDPGRTGHKIYFTHGDLNFRNIFIGMVTLPDGSQGWRITGIIDWEFAGFMPEYWDYTRSMYERFRYLFRLKQMYHSIFMGLGDYSKEFDVELRSWEAGD